MNQNPAQSFGRIGSYTSVRNDNKGSYQPTEMAVNAQPHIAASNMIYQPTHHSGNINSGAFINRPVAQSGGSVFSGNGYANNPQVLPSVNQPLTTSQGQARAFGGQLPNTQGVPFGGSLAAEATNVFSSASSNYQGYKSTPTQNNTQNLNEFSNASMGATFQKPAQARPGERYPTACSNQWGNSAVQRVNQPFAEDNQQRAAYDNNYAASQVMPNSADWAQQLSFAQNAQPPALLNQNILGRAAEGSTHQLRTSPVTSGLIPAAGNYEGAYADKLSSRPSIWGAARSASANFSQPLQQGWQQVNSTSNQAQAFQGMTGEQPAGFAPQNVGGSVWSRRGQQSQQSFLQGQQEPPRGAQQNAPQEQTPQLQNAGYYPRAVTPTQNYAVPTGLSNQGGSASQGSSGYPQGQQMFSAPANVHYADSSSQYSSNQGPAKYASNFSGNRFSNRFPSTTAAFNVSNQGYAGSTPFPLTGAPAMSYQGQFEVNQNAAPGDLRQPVHQYNYEDGGSNFIAPPINNRFGR